MEIDVKDFTNGLARLARIVGGEDIMDDVALVAEELLDKCGDFVPLGEIGGGQSLAQSASILRLKEKRQIVFGYNKVYAYFQDAAGQSAPWFVTPKRKKALFIPLNRKGRSHREGNNPIDEGLIKNVDYVIRESVKIPIKAYGSWKGPNKYFSETIKKETKWALGAIADNIGNRLGRKFKRRLANVP